MKKSIKCGIGIATILAAASLGDIIDLNDRIYYPLVYRDTPIRESAYHDPFSIRKKYIIRNGFLEAQIGDETTNEYYPIMEGLRVNERPLQDQVVDFTGDVIGSIERRANSLIGRLKNIYSQYRSQE